MRPLCIVVEGRTEQLFVDHCLTPYLQDRHGLYDLSARVLGVPGKKGGKVSFARLKFDIDLLLKSRQDMIVSMLVDYYGMGTDFPDYQSCQQLPTVSARISCLEQTLNRAIGSRRFIAYYQQYEFEALLFSGGKSLAAYLKESTCQAIQAVRQRVATPEEINTNNPPSYRLNDLFKECGGEAIKKHFTDLSWLMNWV